MLDSQTAIFLSNLQKGKGKKKIVGEEKINWTPDTYRCQHLLVYTVCLA